jgi:2-polyprenyl-6-methoxyphenol hydroxylase-like FAD-dependent oxidoreductase
MLALLLARHGVASTVFNTAPEVRTNPKGSTHNARTMEHYRRLGLAEKVRTLGLPPDHPTDVAYFTRFNAWELARLPMASANALRARREAAPSTDQVPEPLHRANQMYVEPLLFAEAGRRDPITLRFGWDVESFSQDAACVTLEAAGPEGARERWRAQYLVGCDGGRSFVRRTLGIHYAGFENLQQVFFGGRMLSSHLRIPDLYPKVAGQRLAFQYWAVNPELRLALVALNGRDEFLIWTGAERDDPPAEAIADRVRRAIGVPLEVEVLSTYAWTAGVALHAERFGEGRVQMAGDAVHLFTPTGGFGMNTGVDDTANLSWKLAALVQGWGGANLLASYEAERKPVAIRNTTAARALARNVGSVTIPPDVEADTPAGAAARRELGAFLATFGEEFASIGVQLGARYDASPLVLADGTPPEDDYITYRPSGVPGGRAPHLWLDEGRGTGSSLYDRLGIGFTLLRLGADAPDAAPFTAAAARLGIPFTVLDVALPAARPLYGRALALIRPDQHIAWRGDTLPADPAQVLKTATGHAA